MLAVIYSSPLMNLRSQSPRRGGFLSLSLLTPIIEVRLAEPIIGLEIHHHCSLKRIIGHSHLDEVASMTGVGHLDEATSIVASDKN